MADNERQSIPPDQNDSNEININMSEGNLDLSEATTNNIDTILREQFTYFNSSLPTTSLNQNVAIFLLSSNTIKKFGLSSAQFDALFQIVISNKLNPRRRIELVSLLLPREKVPEEYVVRVVALLPNHHALVLKRLLQWIISIYDIIDSNDEKFKNTYPILFHYLTIASIRTEVCHLLYFMTRRERVTRFRVRRLKEMIDKERDNAALIALLSTYKMYDHTIEVQENVRLKDAIVFEHPDIECRNNLINIRRLWTNTEEEFNLHKPTITFPSTKKRTKKNRDLSTLGPTIDIHNRNLDVEEVLRSVENIEQLNFSEQLDTVLEDRILQHAIVCNPDDSLVLRIGYWLDQKLLYLIRWPNPKDLGKNELKRLLEKLLKLTRFTKAQLPVIEEFLREYFKIWNGFDVQDEIFELIPYLKPDNFKHLNRDILKPLHRLFCISDTTWKTRLILCYTEWLKNWALLDWNKHANLKEDVDQEVDKVTWLFKGLSFDTDYFVSMQGFILHVDRLCVIGLIQEQDHILFQHAALSFFELVSTISVQHDIPKIVTPTSPFVYRNFFSTSAMATSRICNIIYQYKIAFEENDIQSEDSEEYFEVFNDYMLNICNALWKSSGFKEKKGVFDLSASSTDKLIKTCGERGTDIEKILSLTQSAALAGFSKRFMQILEEGDVKHNEHITAEYLTKLENMGRTSMSFQEYRLEYLDHLKEKGMDGIYELLYCCIKSLINKKREET